jgi:hypothetical protein
LTIGLFEADVGQKRPADNRSRLVDFEVFGEILNKALAYSVGSKGGRLAYDCIVMFKLLILASQYDVADASIGISYPGSVEPAALSGL